MLVLVIIFSSGIVVASATASVQISPQSHSGILSGESYGVDVVVDSGVDQLKAAHVKLAYDPSAFEVVSITESTLFDADLLLEPGSGDKGDGTISYGFASYEDNYAPGTGTLISIVLKVSDNAEDGVYSISFTDVMLMGSDSSLITGTATGAVVTVGSQTPEPSAPSDVLDFGSTSESTSGTSGTTATSGGPIPPVSSTAQESDYSYTFGFHPDDYSVMDRYGTVQQDNTAPSDKMETLASDIIKELEDDYLFSKGKVISVGVNSAGYLVIVFYKPLAADREYMDEIYTIMDGKAQEADMSGVPVEFGEGTGPQVSNVLQSLLQRARSTGEAGLEQLTDSDSPVYDPTVLATAGKMPQINTEKECWQWYFRDSYAISDAVRDDLLPYLQSGALLNMGVSPDGYFEVRINEGANVDRNSLMDEVYTLIDREAVNIGINEVPVVFRLASPVDDSLISVPEEAGEEDIPLSEGEAKETPGFAFLAGLLALSAACCMQSVFVKRKP
ncbi:MAG: cohesin domain-containing protein [Methanolobus sp.]|nr:cohesin domain-containing protein [Methanolobus sp.]